MVCWVGFWRAGLSISLGHFGIPWPIMFRRCENLSVEGYNDLASALVLDESLKHVSYLPLEGRVPTGVGVVISG